MKIYLLLTFCVICFIHLNAQVDTLWVKRFNGPLNSSDAGRVVKAGENGFVYVGGLIVRSLGYGDAALIKYNSSGDLVRISYYDNPLNLGSDINDMEVDLFGNIVFTGSSGGTNNYDDCLTVKFDSDGNLLYAQRYDGGDEDRTNAAVTDNLGNVYVTGESWKVNESDNILTIKYSSTGDTIWTNIWRGHEDASDLGKDLVLDRFGNLLVGGTTSWSYGTTDFTIIKFNQLGDSVWVRKYDSPDHAQDNLKAIATDYDGNIFVTGNREKTGGNFDIITIKYTTYGDTLWTRRYNGAGNGDDIVNAMIVDSLGNIYLAGSSFVAGNGIDCLTIKYNSSGELLWAKTYGEYSYYQDVASSIALDNFGNIYVCGSAGTSSSNIAYLTLKYENDGNQKWVTKYDGPGHNGYDVAASLFVDNYGYVYVTGSSAGANSGSDIATIKYTQGPSDAGEESQNTPDVFKLYENYPNPFNPSTVITYQLPLGVDVLLRVFDVLGNEIATLANEEKPAGVYLINWNASSLSSGVYFYKLQAGDYVQTRKMILLK